MCFFFFSSRRRHTRCGRDWSSDVCSSDLDMRIGRHHQLPYIRRISQNLLISRHSCIKTNFTESRALSVSNRLTMENSTIFQEHNSLFSKRIFHLNCCGLMDLLHSNLKKKDKHRRLILFLNVDPKHLTIPLWTLLTYLRSVSAETL